MILSNKACFPTLGLIGLISLALAANSAVADDGQPIAIRHWADQGFTIETMWGFQVGMGVDESKLTSLPRKLDIMLSDIAHGETATLQRMPNEPAPTMSKEPVNNRDGNAVVVSRGPVSSVAVDGLTIVFLNDATVADVTKQLKADNEKPFGLSLEGGQLVIVASNKGYDENLCKMIVDKLQPRLLVVGPDVSKVGEQAVEVVSHNTVAVSNGKRAKPITRVVSLGTQEYQMSKQLADLFAKKEVACKKSRAVFTKLSVAQMNFKPANDTHTPRWNTEHMMGRELHFFSQIYHAVDSEIPVMNLNPAQMPTNYKFAHEDWTGKEEALQTERVEAFTRRFAYLFDGMSLNKRAKGSRFWTPKSLLAQMERHYKQHTDNVVKKMELDGWPTE